MRGTPDAYPFPTFPAPLRFTIALAAVTVVFVVDHLSGWPVDEPAKFILLGMAVMASAWFAGTGPALAATVLGAVLGAEEAGRLAPIDVSVATHLAMFVVQALMLIGVVSELRAARRASDQQAHAALAARRESEAANRTKDQFLATVSHELRTPLNAIYGWVAMLRTGTLDPARQAHALEVIERNTRAQTALVEDLLDMSRAIQGSLRLGMEPLDLAVVLDAAIESLRPTAAAQHLDRLKQMQSQIYRILAERSGKPLRQIIRDTKRTDFYLDAVRARDYGLIDEVLGPAESATPEHSDRANAVAAEAETVDAPDIAASEHPSRTSTD